TAMRPTSDFPDCGKGSRTREKYFGLHSRLIDRRRSADAAAPSLVDLRNRFSGLGTGVEPVVEHESAHDARLDCARTTARVAHNNHFGGQAVDYVKWRGRAICKTRQIDCSGFRIEKRRAEATASILLAPTARPLEHDVFPLQPLLAHQLGHGADPQASVVS